MSLSEKFDPLQAKSPILEKKSQIDLALGRNILLPLMNSFQSLSLSVLHEPTTGEFFFTDLAFGGFHACLVPSGSIVMQPWITGLRPTIFGPRKRDIISAGKI